MPENNDNALARLVIEKGKATPDQVAEAKILAAKMRELGLQKDVLDALVERGAITAGEAASLRKGAAGSGGLEIAPEAYTPTPVASGRPSRSQLPPCANHPHMPGIYKCAVCGKSICMQCAFRTSTGIFCSEQCMVEVSLERGAALRRGALIAGLTVKQIALGAAAVVVLALVAIRALGPSAELSLARDLQEEIRLLERDEKPEEALELAEELASISRGGDWTGREKELRELVEWGETRVDVLRLAVARAEFDGFQKDRPDIETLDPAGLVKYRLELERFAAGHAEMPAAKRAAKKLAARIGERLARMEDEQKEAVVEARRAAASAYLEAARKEAEDLMAKSRYGEALAAVDRHRTGLKPEFVKRLDSLKNRVRTAARTAYARKEAAAKALVWKKRYDEAQAIFRDVIDTFGIEEITDRARRSLEKVYTVQATATPAATPAAPEVAPRRDDLKRVNEALTLVEERLQALDYVGAMLEIEKVSPEIRQKEAAARLEAIAEGVRRDEEAFLAILEMIRKKPRRLSEIVRGGEGEIVEADSGGYTVRVGRRGEGESSFKTPWSRMSAGDLCRLAEMAVGKDTDSLVNLTLFCAGRGSRGDYLKARARVMTSARGGPDPLARFSMRLGRFKAPKNSKGKATPARRDSKRPKAKDEAGGPEIKSARKEPARQAGQKGGAPVPPKTIEADCPYCKASGTVNSIGCGKCRATGVEGSRRCRYCAESGRTRYECRNCRGQGFLILDGGRRDCPICRGKGRPPCLLCRGTGKIKILNPDAAPGPTVTCPYCNGARYNVKAKCKFCSGSGERIFHRTEGMVRWAIHLSCAFCGGKGEGPPLCQGCNGRGYVGSSDTPKLCRSCVGTGHVFRPCRACGGRGWILLKKKRR